MYLFQTSIRHRVSLEFVGSRKQWRTDGVHCRESAGTGSVNLKVVPNKRVLPWQVTMDRLICASLSHTHYLYEVDNTLKVPAIYYVLIMPYLEEHLQSSNESMKTKQNNTICSGFVFIAYAIVYYYYHV